MRELIVTPERVVRERQPEDERLGSVLIYDLEGELFFGAAPELDRHLESLQQETIRTGANYLVLRLRRTRNPDMVAIEHLEHFLHEADQRGVTVLLAGVRPDLAAMLHNLRFQDWLPEDRVFPEEDEKYSATLRAVRHAYRLLGRNGRETGLHAAEEHAAYYLVS